MSVNDTNQVTRAKVGILTVLGILIVGVLTVFVNDRPYWWRSCEPIYINIEDATGLKTKSPVRSLGLQVGYLRSVSLSETHVRLGICITAPVEVIPDTRAYIRGEGFLGDKFVELKPVRYVGNTVLKDATPTSSSSSGRSPSFHGDVPAGSSQEEETSPFTKPQSRLWNFLMPSAYAAPGDEVPGKEIPVGNRAGDMDKLMEKADQLMVELTQLSKNLKEGLDPKDLRQTVQQLNKTLDSVSKSFSPEGGLNSTARRALAKLEASFENLRQIMERINRGEGSIGKLVNDPAYAEEMMKAMKNVNKFLNKANDIRFAINLGAEQIPVYDGGRGFFQLQIWPNPTRYYLIGISLDPRGRLNNTNTTTIAGGQTTYTRTEEVQETGILLTAMLGKKFYDRFDFSAGALHGDGAVSGIINLGPKGNEEAFHIRDDIYVRGRGIAINNRIILQVHPLMNSDVFKSVYVRGGLESTRKVDSKYAWSFGAGLTFDDEEIKLLFAFR